MSRSFARYFDAALNRRVAELRDRGATRRSLTRAASDLGQLLHLDGADREKALSELVSVALATNPSAGRDEVRRTIEAGFTAGRAKPYTPDGAAASSPAAPSLPAGDLSERVSQLEARLDQLVSLIAKVRA
jgi:hypothetical protein